jgi:drug/metabolite transporter (DMT)-like permease
MSRSLDNAKGSERSPILGDIGSISQSLLAEDIKAATINVDTSSNNDGPRGHRKTQSLLTIPTAAGRRHHARHHRHKSSIGYMLETVAEGFQTEALMVRQAWEQELEDGELGKRYFLDMNLTRSLCVLPEDIQEFAMESVGRQSISRSTRLALEQEELLGREAPQIPPPSPAASLGSYLALLSAVLAVSSNGTALAMLHDVHPALKLFWRMTAVAAVLSFFALKTMTKRYRQEGQFFPLLTLSQWLTFVSAAVCFFLHTLLLFTALTFTSIGNAVTGANSQALLLVLGKLITGQHVFALEGFGVLTAFVGCILCAGDDAHEEANEEGEGKAVDSTAFIGDAMAVSSAAVGVGYLTFAKAVRPHLSVTVFMFMVMLTGCMLCFIYLWVTGVSFSWGNDPQSGLFGWVTLENQHVYIVLYVALVCNVIGTMGFVRAMEFFDNIIIAVATLLEPMIATLIAYFLGVGDLPSTYGWIGYFLVAVGTLGVVYPSIHDKSGGGDGH